MAKLYFYYSAMNAGKTTTLLQASHNYNEREMSTLLFTPCFDDRYGKNKIVSRIGISSEAIPFDKSHDFYNYITDLTKNNGKKIHCILIDEAQFLSKKHVSQLCDVVDELNIPILCYGLRTNFLGETFEGSQYLLAWADEMTEIKTICHCGSKASMTMRVDENGQAIKSGNVIEIGGNDRYVAVCRKHFKQQTTKREENDIIQNRERLSR